MQAKVFRIERTFAGRRTATAPRRYAAEDRSVPPAAGVQPSQADELARMQETVARHRRELAALIVDGRERRMTRAAGELCAAVESMEKATQKILKAAETIDDDTKTLFATLKTDAERGLAHDIQDRLLHIYEACNFQDLAGQRIGKVIATLDLIEGQIGAMLARGRGAALQATDAGDGLINGPRLDGDTGHISQNDIDAMFD